MRINIEINTYPAAKIWCFLLCFTLPVTCSKYRFRCGWKTDLFSCRMFTLSFVIHRRTYTFCTACTSLSGRGEAQAAHFGPDRSSNTLHVQLPGITILENQKSQHLIKCWWLGEGWTTKFLTRTQQKSRVIH